MIGQKHRFHGHNSLRYVYGNGRTVRNQDMAIRFADNPRRKNYRCAVVVSKKVSKSAVTRNRIRRRIYELVRGYEDRIQGAPDIVVTVYVDTISIADYSKLSKDFNRLFSDTGLLVKS